MSVHGNSIGKEPCPKCGSQDNVAVYEDGYRKCFGMGCDFFAMPEGEYVAPKATPKVGVPMIPLADQEFAMLRKRALSEETCTKWKYGIAEYKGKKVQVANYMKDGRLVAQKIRFANKDFLMLGDGKAAGFYGQHLWRDGGKSVVVTEGEIDALSVSQMFKNKYAVVSLPKGAQGAARTIKQELEWLLKFDHVVLMFDNDEAGQLATEEVCSLLPPGRVKIATLPLKDANEMLTANRGGELVSAYWDAKVFRPDGILSIGDVKDDCLKPMQQGVPWPFKELNDATFGRRDGEVYAIGGGTGTGKTDLFTQCIKHDAIDLDIRCGVLYLEQPPVETVRRIAGKLAGKKFHLPDAGWTTNELEEAITQLDQSGNVILYNHFGTSDWDVIESRIRYMVTGLGCKHIYLDHLTALAAHAEDERRELEGIMADLAGLAQELMFKLHFISHLATPEGKPHEEGGRVMIRHFKGSRAIGFWSHYMIGIERNQQDRGSPSILRVLKDRYTGQATGFTMGLAYDPETTLLTPCALETEDSGFKNETTQGDF